MMPDAAKIARYDDLANLVEELHDQNMLLLAALHSCTTDEGPDQRELDHARAILAKAYAGETASVSARQMVARLVDVMERSDAEQFGAEAETVTADEWFAAIRAAKEMLA